MSLVSEYCHYEGVLAWAYELPILALLEEGVAERVLFMPYAGEPIIQIPVNVDPAWVEPDFLARSLANLHLTCSKLAGMLFWAIAPVPDETAQ